MGKVEYPKTDTPPNEIVRYAEAFLESIYAAIAKGNTKDIYFNDYTLDFLFLLATNILIENSIFFKNPAFREEEEWRLVLNWDLSKTDMELHEDNSLSPSELSPKRMQFRGEGNKIVSFFDLSFKGHEDEIIKEVFIGPKSEVEEDDIHHLLSYYWYNEISDVTVEKSKATYR